MSVPRKDPSAAMREATVDLMVVVGVLAVILLCCAGLALLPSPHA